MTDIGSVASLWRYPVKSMIGEELTAAEVTARGLLGDRAYAIVDLTTSKVASAKNPRKWPHLLDCRANFTEPPTVTRPVPEVQLVLPDGTTVNSGKPECDEILSRMFGRRVQLQCPAPNAPRLEEYWPDIEGLAYRETVTDEPMPPETFFDLASVHLLTTATIEKLTELYPQGRFDLRRFRPNIVVAPSASGRGFVEDDWVGRTLLLGDTVRLSISGPCPRCVMTTLPQQDLPADAGILRTVAQHNQVNVGVYAAVQRGGTVRHGDVVRLE